ncbi:ABC transporter ATP-binding protein [Cecembia lonarensis]|uniref:Arginine transport ATP-binding protein ArtM n=1 Tax=Cecembia lonarensis (strain CCUG 58316 / KCTC 22772 / LW9) TaxID=1225176 RepID=K1L9Y2_CECL9|nr:ATP-binding cassette domain-containing protein [Cecembia lonarensis]EKB49062.1 Arginine transport ATP-binding protein ArtM [Cecembia lonarensis LW9]
MEIKLDSAGKRFQYDWIFKNLNKTISEGSALAITGSNGSGKSTLLKCVAALNPLTEGKITYTYKKQNIPESEIFNYLVISAPYMELPEEFQLSELLQFHFKFKKTVEGISFTKMMDRMYLSTHKSKPISQFSSGMKQRLKLGLCLFSDVPLILLDEPTSNLDEKGLHWYLELIGDFAKGKTVLICSNDEREYGFCQNKIHIEDYKLSQRL